MRITITITDVSDSPDGGVKVTCEPPGESLMEFVQQNGQSRSRAYTTACMYALGMLTWMAKKSRELKGHEKVPLIHLPPGIRNG